MITTSNRYLHEKDPQVDFSVRKCFHREHFPNQQIQFLCIQFSYFSECTMIDFAKNE